jgi:ubiquitin carboxyl-terminal hydrolase L5
LKGKAKDKQDASHETEEETYHFIGYVPAHGKVWELDGLKSGPLEVGELPVPAHGSSSSSAPGTQPPEEAQNSDWMSVARPALRMKMEKYGGSATSGTNIRFSLLAIVDDLYQKASDELEFLKREKVVLERKLMQQTEQWKGDEWQSKVGVDVFPLPLLLHDVYIHRSRRHSCKHPNLPSLSQTDPPVQVVFIPGHSPPEK